MERRMEVLRFTVGNPNYELMVAELNGEAVGFVDQWFIHDFSHGGKLSYIQNLYVTPRCRELVLGASFFKEP